LSDERIALSVLSYEQFPDAYQHGMERARDHYERLITEGKLRVAEEAIRLPYAHASERNVYGEPLDACSLCNGALSDNTPKFCPGCGNSIKKP
jgi:rubrerythrin